ncbi:unnamed protein product [Didymodactylos carnosus]|uniref:HAT C-terminal dimerisation domain-containing protein n=1 Tax=Didymodactylos carnosus TaxID=1234261 RepID=A0A815R614_9BILA|nr:unnamed protein product [Didymodactylos carnosus]CAF1472270.1 unnamed protein product [Didymodactylos carnosus]CAF3946840.1 unnamed protein product [Didymodactylos carnosus]CAF4339569.1 unnamed protein product [Didymodactylos carnosus]
MFGNKPFGADQRFQVWDCCMPSQDMLSVFIRFVDDELKPVERFVSIKETLAKTGGALSSHILSVLEENGLDNSKLISQNYDYAKNMSGEMKGAQNQISMRLKRNIVYIPCAVHRNNTVVKHASEENTDIVTLLGRIQSIYNFFMCSSKCFTKQLKSTSTTRWNAKYESVRVVLESFNEIVEALNEIGEAKDDFDNDSRKEAKSIANNIQTDSFIVYLIFMKNLLAATNALNSELQKDDLNIITAIEILAKTVDMLTKDRNNDECLKNLIVLSEKMAEKYSVDFNEEFKLKHCVRRSPKIIDDNPQTTHVFTQTEYYSKQFRAVYDLPINEYSDVIANMTESVKSSAKLSPQLIHNVTIDDRKQIYDASLIDDPTLLFSAIALYSTDIEQCQSLSEAAASIKQKQSLPRLFQACRFLLSFPVTVASNERGFSELKLVKNRLRSTIGD